MTAAYINKVVKAWNVFIYFIKPNVMSFSCKILYPGFIFLIYLYIQKLY